MIGIAICILLLIASVALFRLCYKHMPVSARNYIYLNNTEIDFDLKKLYNEEATRFLRFYLALLLTAIALNAISIYYLVNQPEIIKLWNLIFN
jgi:hypothetical protein